MKKRILWADDEIDMLRPFVAALSADYDVETVSNGSDCLETFAAENFDLVILDEQMPGKTGLDVLVELKEKRPSTPVVMMTKSEKEETADTALGRNIDDYLVKPINISQLKVALKKIFQRQDLVREEMRRNYNAEYRKMQSDIAFCRSFAEWAELYRRIVLWELRLDDDEVLTDMHLGLKTEANSSFAKFIEKDYEDWFSPKPDDSRPLLSSGILDSAVKPLIDAGEKVALIVIDNFRLDQWELIRPQLEPDFDIDARPYCSILPTATQFSRNAIFSALMPRDIKARFPQYWPDDERNEDSLNQYERQLLDEYFKRRGLAKSKSCSYYKVGSDESGQEYMRKFGGYRKNALNALVFSFVDALSHNSAESYVIRELTSTDASYRSITLSWFQNGVLHKVLDFLGEEGYTIVLTTDHGTIRVSKPVDITGTSVINSNMRYKTDSKMRYDEREVFELIKPDKVGLPGSWRYVFATDDGFFVYPNNRSDYVSKFRDTFQHGGVSLEEMILPLVVMRRKK